MLKATMNLSTMNRLRSTRQVTFGDVHYPPGSSFGPRDQRDLQLVVVHHGAVRVQIDDTGLEIAEQQCLLLHPGSTELFSFSPQRDTRHTWCAIHPSLVPADLGTALEPFRGPLPLSKRVNDLMEYGLNLPASQLKLADDLLHTVALAILRAVLFDSAHAQQLRREPIAVGRAKLYIDAHLETPLTLSKIASAANVSAQHLTRLFQRHLGTTPTKYLWTQRTERGVQLLLDTGLSVSEIAERVGFASAFHFSRLVKTAHGASPRVLRQRRWRDHKNPRTVMTIPRDQPTMYSTDNPTIRPPDASVTDTLLPYHLKT